MKEARLIRWQTSRLRRSGLERKTAEADQKKTGGGGGKKTSEPDQKKTGAGGEKKLEEE